MGVLDERQAVAESNAAREFAEYASWATQNPAAAIDKAKRENDLQQSEALLGLLSALRRDGVNSGPVRRAMSSLADQLAIAQHYLGRGRHREQLTAYEPSLSELYTNLLRSGLEQVGLDKYSARDNAKNAIALAEWSPLGVLTAADDTRRAFNRGAYGEAALSALGAIPMFGKGVRLGGRKALKAAKEMFANGASHDEIRQATGWILGRDKKWRSELPEAEAQAAAELNDLARAQEIDGGAAELTGRLAEVDPPRQPPRVPAQAADGPAEPPRPTRSPLDGLFEEDVYPKDVPQRPLPRYDPPRGTSERLRRNIDRPEIREAFIKRMEDGQARGGRNAVNLEPLRLKYLDELGKDRGNQWFNHLTEHVGGTTALSTPDRNVRNASYYYHLHKNGLPVQGKPAEGFRHIAQDLHGTNAKMIISGSGLDPRFRPKSSSLIANLQGNLEPMQIDRHFFRDFGMLTQDPEFLATYYKARKEAPARNIRKEFFDKKITMEEALSDPTMWDSAAAERIRRSRALRSGHCASAGNPTGSGPVWSLRWT